VSRRAAGGESDVRGAAPAAREPCFPSWDEAVAALLAALPADLCDLGVPEVQRHLAWMHEVAAEPAGCSSREDAAGEAHGATLVARRRVLELLRAELIRCWAECSPTAEAMLSALTRLEDIRNRCTPGLEQSFSAELADYGGLDLVVEVAHDMRSPLTSILFLSEILHSGQSGELSALQKRQVGIVYSAALGLVGITSDMIEMARGGSRLMGETPVPFSVNEALRSVQGLVQPMAEEKGLELRIRKLVSEHRIGYSIPLGRILLNLATNALKFTSTGSVEISAVSVRGNVVEFPVTDTGPGISENAMETLYQPFRRERDRKTGYQFSGTGLGLAICRRLLLALGSELQVESTKGAGTRFFFRLDLPPASSL
jgi:signal transduction histidine kinase